jgi:hypothetical protein
MGNARCLAFVLLVCKPLPVSGAAAYRLVLDVTVGPAEPKNLFRR